MYLYKDYNCSYQLCITRESSIFDFGSWTCCVELLHGTGLQKIIDVGKPIKYLLFDSLMKLRNLLRGGHSRKKGIWYCRQTNMCFGSPQRRYRARLLTKFFVLNTCKQGTDVLSWIFGRLETFSDSFICQNYSILSSLYYNIIYNKTFWISCTTYWYNKRMMI